MSNSETILHGAPTKVAKHEDLVYDIGLHRGEDSDFYLKKGFRVVAFEANPYLAAECRQRFQAEILTGRLTLVEGAIVPRDMPGIANGKVKFYRNLQNSVWGTISADWAERNEHMRTESEVIEVDCVDFANCIREFGMPYYMKIDIEGADLVCLSTLLEFDCRPNYLSIESERVRFSDLLTEFDWLERLGYKRFAVVQQADVQRQTPPDPPGEGLYIPYRFEPGASGLFGREVPNRWLTRSEAETAYRRIFTAYKLFSENSLLFRFRIGRFFINKLSRFMGTPIPGWYDTHARLSADC